MFKYKLIIINNMNFEKYKDKGLSGLANLGNTCFLNSAMQVLSHTYELNMFLDKNNSSYKTKLNKNFDSILLVEWDELRNMLWKENAIITPNKFVSTVQKLAKIKKQDLFTGYSQNDLPEFLIFVIDCFHNALTREVIMSIEGKIKDDKDAMAVKCFEMIKRMYEKDFSEIWRIFYGTQITQIQNIQTNEVVSIVPEPFFILNLPIPNNNKNPTLLDCFDLYVLPEVLDGDNRITCEKTKEKIDTKKYTTFWSLPDILVIDIKRAVAHNKKNQIAVDFPLEDLNLSKYVVGYNNSSYIYDLYGVCNHSGSTFGGHYTAFVKNANGKWYHFNDTSVSEVSNKQQIITPKAYCFFYRKTNK